jgi:acyl-CoA reductase-like NAD-dependent aldehyde dehydrogenase
MLEPSAPTDEHGNRTTSPRVDQNPTLVCHDPATRELLGEVKVTPLQNVPQIVQRARSAQAAWAKTTFAERRRVLGIVLDQVLAHARELSELVVRDTGKTLHNATLGELWPVLEKLRWTIAHGERYLADEVVSSGWFVHKRARIEYAPLGVIGVIAPWNYPLQNILGPTIPALMAGNAVVVKPSEWVAWSSARFVRLLGVALADAGHSPELVQIVQGDGAAGAALIDAGIDKVIFTGSLENGKRVLAQAARQLIPTVLELGGKDALIVCDDAHLAQAVHATLTGAFLNCGQNCLASERILVFEKVYDSFTAQLCAHVKALRQGPPRGDNGVDCGAIVSPLQLDRIESLVSEAVAQGATLLVGGSRVHEERGQYYAPTVLADVTPAMRIANEEVFGPVVLLFKVRDEAHALGVANGTPFGLGATVMTRCSARARRITRALNVGNVSVNDFGLTYMAMSLPFGGVKGSGFGRLNGRDGLRACTAPKAVLEDRLPLHVPARVFPVGPKDADVAREVLTVLYARGLRNKLAAGKRLTRTLLGSRS